jgi:hypothetical protein
VAWEAATSAGMLEVFEPALIFAVGNAYHEYTQIGQRIARYHDLTETVVFPLLGGLLIDSGSSSYGLDTNRRWRDVLVDHDVPEAYAAAGRLTARLAGHAAFTEEILAEMDHKFNWMDSVRVQLNAAVAGVRRR